MQDRAIVIRHFLNQRATPEREEAWLTWQTQNPEDARELTTLRQDTSALLQEARALAARAARIRLLNSQGEIRARARTLSPCAGPKVTL